MLDGDGGDDGYPGDAFPFGYSVAGDAAVAGYVGDGGDEDDETDPGKIVQRRNVVWAAEHSYPPPHTWCGKVSWCSFCVMF